MDWDAELRTRLAASRALLVDAISKVSEPGWLVKPADGGWSAFEVLEHISRVDRSVARVTERLATQGEADPTCRAPETGERQWEATILKRAGARPFPAPPSVMPKGETTRPEIMVALEQSRAQIEAILPRLRKLDTDRLLFPHPLGFDLNALQWVDLAAWHETRHVVQLQRTQL